MTMIPISQALVSQLEAICRRFAPPAIAALHVPGSSGTATNGKRDAAFCAIELQDGAFGLSYLMLGDTLDRMTGNAKDASSLARPMPSGSGATLRQQRRPRTCIGPGLRQCPHRLGLAPCRFRPTGGRQFAR